MQALEARGNLKKMLREIPLTNSEREAVEDGARLMDALFAGLEKARTPDGRTQQQIEASGRERLQYD